MAVRKDLMRLPNGDLPIGAKLLTTAPSDLWHQRDMFSAFPGAWKQFTQNGIGIAKRLKSSGNNLMVLKSMAAQALIKDGYEPGTIEFRDLPDGKLQIITNATR